MIHIEYILVVSAVMLFAGIYGFLTRKSTLAMLLSIELMLNAADLNFAVFDCSSTEHTKVCSFRSSESPLQPPKVP